MNVLKELLNVMVTATISLAVILATVLDLVIFFIVMVSPVKVLSLNIIDYFNIHNNLLIIIIIIL